MMFLDAIESFSETSSPDALWDRFHKTMAPYGIRSIIYSFGECFSVENISDYAEKAFLLTSYPEEYIELNSQDCGLDDDFYWEWCRFSSTPLLWNQEDFVRGLTPEQRMSVDLDWEFGLVTGVTLPLHFNQGLGGGGIGLNACGLSWAEFDKTWAEHGETIRNLATAFDICMRERHIGDIYPLSPREKECLLWLASGLRPQQIAHRLNTHPKTVEKQIVSARRKLKADTVCQAVAKSLIFGVITP